MDYNIDELKELAHILFNKFHIKYGNSIEQSYARVLYELEYDIQNEECKLAVLLELDKITKGLK